MQVTIKPEAHHCKMFFWISWTVRHCLRQTSWNKTSPLPGVGLWAQRVCPACPGSSHLHCLDSPEEALTKGGWQNLINSSIPLLSHGQGSPPMRVNYRRMNSTRVIAQEIPVHIPWFAHVCSIAQTLFHMLAHAALRKTERNFPPLLSGVSHSNVRAWMPDSFQLEAGLLAQCHLTLLGASDRKAEKCSSSTKQTMMGGAAWIRGILRNTLNLMFRECIFHSPCLYFLKVISTLQDCWRNVKSALILPGF